MKIGGVGVPDTTSGYGGYSQPRQQQVAPAVDVRGLSALAGAVQSVGDVGQSYLAFRAGEEKQRQNYDAELKYQKFTGEFARQAEDMQATLPPDGSGYSDSLQENWTTGYGEFEKQIPADLREKFSARAEADRQGALLRADEYTRATTKSHATETIAAAVDSAKSRTYRDPSVDVADQIGALISAAPGMSEDDKAKLAREAQAAINGARFGGIVRNGRVAMTTAPFSKDVSERLVPAVIQVESAGHPGAVSPKGATGLMQIMLATAGDIALKIRDTKFPHGGSVGEKREYLKQEGVNITYGTFYLNELLQRYGGDVELALVGYNAGPGVADKYQAAGRNPGMLPEETRNYVTKVAGLIGGITPDMALDPQFGLNAEQMAGGYDQAEQILNQAERDATSIITANAKVAQERQAATLEGLMMQARGGKEFEPMYLAAVYSGQLAYKDSDLRTGIEVSNSVLKEQHAAQAAIRDFANGSALSPDQGDIVVPQAITDGIAKGDSAAINHSISAASQMGFIPPRMEKTLNGMLYSQDMNAANIAATIISNLERSNPSIVRNLAPEVVARADSFTALNDVQTPQDEIAQIMSATATVGQRKTLEAARNADPDYKKSLALTPTELTGWFDSWAQRNLPGVAATLPPADIGQMELLHQQYQELYPTYYATTMNAEQAKELTMRALQRVWYPSTVGNGPARLTYLPPEITLTNFNYDLNGNGTLVTVQQSPAAARAMFDMQAREQIGTENYYIVARPDTATAARTGKPVPYTIYPTDADGNFSWDFAAHPEQLEFLAGKPVEYDYGKTIPVKIAAQKRMEEIQQRLIELGVAQNPERPVTVEEINSPERTALIEEMKKLETEIINPR